LVFHASLEQIIRQMKLHFVRRRGCVSGSCSPKSWITTHER